MKRLKRIGKWTLIVLIVANVLIVVTGNTYLYTVLAHTVFKGRLGPSIDERHIFYNRELPANNPQPWPLAHDYGEKSLPEDRLERFEELGTVAYAIFRDDSLVFEQYWEKYGHDVPSNSFSMAKTVVSILIGQAIDEGKISSVDQPVGDFLPQYKEGKNAELTIRHLLTMSAGIEYGESYINPFAFPARANYGTDLRELVFGYDVTLEPGETFNYTSGSTQLLGFVLQEAVGKTISEYATEKLWGPLGAEHPAFWSLDKENGDEKAFCCLHSNARDFARFGQLYLDGGRWKGKQLVSEAYVKASIEKAPLVEKYDNNVPNIRYGYSWWLMEQQGMPMFYMRGLLGQYVVVIPEKRMIVVRLGHKRDKGPDPNKTPLDLIDWVDVALEMYP